MAHVLVTGGSGFLGHHIAGHLAAEGHSVHATYHDHAERTRADGQIQAVALDLTSEESIELAFRAAWPEVVIHTAAISELKACEVDPDHARQVNVEATRKLGKLCAAFGARIVFLSTDQVFAGDAGPYREQDPTGPLHTYGRTKVDAEEALRRVHPDPTILRIALVYGRSPTGDRSASEKVVQSLRSGQRARLFVDETRTPILADDVASACAALMGERNVPLLHLGGPDRVTRHEFGVAVARAFGLDLDGIEEARAADLDLAPPRPADVSFDTRRARSVLRRPPRPLDKALTMLASAEASRTETSHPEASRTETGDPETSRPEVRDA